MMKWKMPDDPGAVMWGVAVIITTVGIMGLAVAMAIMTPDRPRCECCCCAEGGRHAG